MGERQASGRAAQRRLSRAARNVALAALSTAAATVGLVLPAAPAFAATTFVVTSSGDSGAGSLRAALLAANTTPNGTSGPDRITFAIPGAGVREIRLATPLPAVTDAVVIDGFTQPGSTPNTLAVGSDAVRLVALLGDFMSTNGPGLDLKNATGSTVSGLIVDGFTSRAVVTGPGTKLTGNFIGDDPTTTTSKRNGVGVYVDHGPSVRIGDVTPAGRNVISGNGIGVEVEESTGTVIVNSYVGTDAAGAAAVPNGDGIRLGEETRSTQIGGTDPLGGNVISGNTGKGIRISGTSATNTNIRNNAIGTNAGGLIAVPNEDGVFIGNGSITRPVLDTLIGDGTTAGRNVISGNRGEGIAIWGGSGRTVIRGNHIGVGRDAVTPLGNHLAAVAEKFGGIVIRNFSNDNVIGGNNPSDGNVIATNGGDGVTAFSGTGNRIVGNRMFDNAGFGIHLSEGETNDPGDIDGAGKANRLQNFPVIGLARIINGMLVADYSLDTSVGASDTPIQIDVYGAEASGEGKTFVARTELATAGGSASAVLGAAATLGVTAGDRLVATATDAKGNTSMFSAAADVFESDGTVTLTVNDTGDTADATPGNGVCATATGTCTLRAAIAEANVLIGNDIIDFALPVGGVPTITLQSALPPIVQSLVIDGTTQTGASCAGGPGGALVQLDANGVATAIDASAPGVALTLRGLVVNDYAANGVVAHDARIECNIIGADATGTATVRTATGAGVVLGANSSLGGPSPSQRNLIAGNQAYHVDLTGSASTVQGNVLGTDLSGTVALGTGVLAGVRIGGANDTLIGGAGAGEGNRIVGAAVGVLAQAEPAGTGNRIRGNTIAGSSTLGIDLGGDGVTLNHLGVAPGPNRYQNFPVLSVALSDAATTRVAGRVDGTADAAYDIDVFANTACHATFFGEGRQYLGTLRVTADANGLVSFDQTLPGGVAEPGGIAATATNVVTGDTSELSYCRPVASPNVTWVGAQPVAPSATQYITDNLQEKWFKFSVQPGETVKVQLTARPGSAVSLHRDPHPIYDALTQPANSAVLNAEAADTAFLPSGFLPSGFLPSGFLPSGFLPSGFLPSGFLPSGFLPSGALPSGALPSGFLPSGFLPSGFLPSGFLPSGFLPSGFLPSGFLPSGFLPSGSLPTVSLPSGFLPSGFLPSGFLPAGSTDAYSSAARRSLLGISMDPAAAVQTIERNTYDLNEDLYIRVVGPLDLATPFHLTVTVTGGVCGTVESIATGSSVNGAALTDTGRKTVIVTDASRLVGTTAEKATALADLQRLAARADVVGVIVDLADTATYPRVAAANAQADANPACPSAKNIVADEIKHVIDAYHAANTPPTGRSSVAYIVLAGGAEVIPFHQTQDVAGLAAEKEYVAPVAPSTPSDAGLRSNLVKGQDFYGSQLDLSIAGRTLAVPGLAVGRLVDGAADVSAAVTTYINADGVVTPRSSVTTGYDFVGDAAAAIANEMTNGIGVASDTLIQPPGEAPTGPNAWTADQLRAKLFGPNTDVVTLTGHFSAGDLVAADYTTTLTSAELSRTTADLTNAIVLALGCHSGFSIPDTDVLNGASPDPDWAKAFLRKGAATFVAATGYAYGDTELTEYGEKLFLQLARQMRTGTGPIAMGDALVAAKRAYLASTAQVTGIDEKTVVEMTLYGLPMMKVNMPGTRLTVAGTPSAITTAPAPVAAGPGAGYGLTSTTTRINPTLTERTKALANLGADAAANPTIATTYYEGRDGVVANPFEPLQPKQIDDVSVSGQVLRGVAFRGGTYTDHNGITPLTAAPTTETSRAHTSFTADVFYPNQIWSPNFYDAVDGGATRLVSVPGQFQSGGVGSTTGTLRTYGNVDLALFYLPADWTAAGAPATVKAAAVSAAPVVYGARATVNGTQLTFSVNVQADSSAGVQSVWVLYTGLTGSPLHGRWAPLDLTPAPGDPTTWSGTLDLGTAAASSVRFMVQAVNGAGLATLATNEGAYYSLDNSTAARTATAIALVSPPTATTFRTSTSFTARLTSAGVPLAGQPVVFDIGGQQALGTTDASGVATASISPVVTPGPYTVQASFRGAAGLQASSAASPVTVDRSATAVLLTPAASTVSLGQTTPVVARLQDAAGNGLGGKPVAFVVSTTGPSPTIVDVRFVRADNVGDARLGTLGLGYGTYTVDAWFDGHIPLGGGRFLDLDDDTYTASRATAPVTVTIADTTRPVITASATAGGLAYAAGTYANKDVTVAFTCDDGPTGSGIASCGPTQIVAAEGTTAAVTGTAVDGAGNTQTATFGPIRIDRTGPTIVITTPTAGATYKQSSVVTAAYACTDAGAGPGPCTGPVANGARVDTTTLGLKSFTVNATDALGNTSVSTVTYTVVVANAAPVVKADMGVAGLEEIGFQTNVVALVGSFADPDGPGPYTAAVRWSAGAAFTQLILNNNSQFVAAFIYPSAGARTVTVRVCDAANVCGTDDVTVRSEVTTKVIPVKQCVLDRGAAANPRYAARFGYTNPATFPIAIPILPATENFVTPNPAGRGQPQVFLPGTNRTGFSADFNSGTVSWKLNGTTVSLTTASPRC